MGDIDMSALLADAGLEKAQRTVSVINTRLTDMQCDVVDLRNRIASLALVATIDPSHEPELAELRGRLAEAEARSRELGAAQQLAQTMAREASEKALLARRDSDWAAAAEALDEAVITAQSLDAMARQFGDLYRRLQTELARAAALAATHMHRFEHKMLVQPPSLDLPLRLVVANAGGPQVAEREVLHLSAAERTGASVADVVTSHSQRVMAYRPVTVIEQEEADHGD
jgi:hypothetical protein